MPTTGIYTRNNRFAGVKRNYTPEAVAKLRGSLKIEYTVAKRGSEKLWEYLTQGGDTYINALGSLTGIFFLLKKMPSFLFEDFRIFKRAACWSPKHST